MKRTLLALLAATATTTATTIPFESAADLDAYATVITETTATLTQGASFGAGNPVTGGLRFAGDTSGSDRASVSHRPLPGDASTQNSWTTSILVNFNEFDTLAQDKAELRLGFTTDTNVSPSKPHEFFHKSNPSISLKLNAEHKTSDPGKIRRLDLEINNRVNNDTKHATTFVNDSIHFDDWLKVTLTIIRTGTDTFDVSYLLESLGTDGTATPFTVLSTPPVEITNDLFASATTLHTGFAIKTEKNATTPLFLDDHTFLGETLSPSAPTAEPATFVAATGLSAQWIAPHGVPPTSYIVELSLTSDNFAPNTLIAADGTPGQATGVTIAATDLLLAFTNLLPETSYSYRVIAANSNGSSAPSNTITAITLPAGTNNPPTLDPIADQGPVSTFIDPILIPLTGVTAGGETGQTLTATVTPADTSIIASGSVSTPDASGNATLTLIPTGTQGSTLITILLDDGQPADNTFSRSFTLTVRDPLEFLTFDTAADLDELEIATNTNVSHTWFANAGTGDPTTGGVLVATTNTSGDRGFAVHRQQGNDTPGATFLRTSILLNAAQLDDVSSEASLDFRLGYLATFNLNPSKPHEFLHKSNDSIHLRVKMEHKPSDPGKQRKIEGELASATAGSETKVGKLTATNAPEVNDWLRLTLDLFPTGGDDFLASWKIESLGEFGTDPAVTVLESSLFLLTNPTLASATTLHASYAGKLDKQLTSIRLDDHQSLVNRSAPDAPDALPATFITATGFNANWQPGSATPSSSWTLEVIADGDTFTPGNFLAADGTPAQPTGIPIPDGALRTLHLENLTGATTYLYRLIGTNLNGSSPPSNEISILTLPPGINAPPTLNPIPKPAPIAINASQQTLTLTGITTGGEPGQTLTVTAVSSNPSLIPDPTVTYTSPETTALLAYTPLAGAVGTAIITVTVDDGASNNSSVSRTFTVTVVDPDPLLDFDDLADFNSLAIFEFDSTLDYDPENGTGANPGSGSLAFQGNTPGADRVAVAIRPTAFDASSAVHLITSLDFKAADVFSATTGKERGELRLGFITENTPNASKPQDTLTKTHPSIALRFKVEHEPGKAGKERLLEGEIVSWTGSSEIKGQKIELPNFYTDDHWLRVTLTAVRSGESTAILSYTIDDLGPHGTTFLGRVIESGTLTLSNAAFFSDNTIFSAATLSDEKNSTANLTLRADNYFAEVNTTAPTAPATQQVSGITSDGFTANWTPALDGNFPDGFIVEIVPIDMPFVPGNFLSATGTPGQPNGIAIHDAFAESLPITGLNSLTTYRVRVRAFSNSESVSESLALNSVFATTLSPPGLEYPDWRVFTFGPDADNDLIAAPDAINNPAGISNLLAYAFGLDPFAPNLDHLPQADTQGEFLRLTYRRRHNVTSVTLTPEICNDLTDWNTHEIVLVSISPPDAEGIETVTVEDEFPITESPRRFMRVGIFHH